MRLIVSGIFLTFILLAAHEAKADPLVVAVLDTGFNVTPDVVPLCNQPLPDVSPRLHGSNVAGLIAQEAGVADYCLLIIRVFQVGANGKPEVNLGMYFNALQLLVKIRPFAVNLSFGGETMWPTETKLIKELLKLNVIVVAAAGNDKKDLDSTCNYFPACIDKRVIVVGSTTGDYSNKGARVVDFRLDGSNRTAAGTTLSGTSQAAALFTGLLIRSQLENR